MATRFGVSTSATCHQRIQVVALERTLHQPHAGHRPAATGLGVEDLEHQPLAADRAGVADLSTALGVEGRGVDADLVLVAVERAHAQDPRFRAQGVVADEAHRRAIGAGLAVDPAPFLAALARLELPGGPRALALLLHLVVESLGVDRQVLLLGHDRGEVDGKAVGVVQHEGLLAGDPAVAALDGLVGELAEALQTAVEGLEEALLLHPDHALDVLAGLAELAVVIAHPLDHHVGAAVQEGLTEAEVAPVAHGPAQDAAQDVAAAVVARPAAVGHGEGQGTDVVGDHLHAHALLVVAAVGPALAGDPVEDRREQVGAVVAGHPLLQRGQALQAHAGVDALQRQGLHGALGVAIVLDEHQVPDLEVAIAVVLTERTIVAVGQLGTLVVVDLRARAAGTGVAHAPEVLLVALLDVAQAMDPVGGHTHDPVPDLEALVVVLVDADQQLVLVELHGLRQELPGPLDRLALVVVAEAPVAEHLEERVVTAVAAHRLEVVVLAAHPHALLRVGRAHVAATLGAQQQGLELVHAGVREQQGGVVLRDQRGTRHDLVAALGEEVQEGLADLVTGQHGLRSVPSGSRWGRHRGRRSRARRPARRAGRRSTRGPHGPGPRG